MFRGAYKYGDLALQVRMTALARSNSSFKNRTFLSSERKPHINKPATF
jgi:hypothetical protein